MLMVSFVQVVSQFSDTYYLKWPSSAESAFSVRHSRVVLHSWWLMCVGSHTPCRGCRWDPC